MRDFELREAVEHGDRLFPLAVYQNSSEGGPDVLYAHWHDEFEVVRLRCGAVVFQVGGKHYYLNPGDMLFVPHGELHAAFSLDNGPSVYDALVFAPVFLAVVGYELEAIRLWGGGRHPADPYLLTTASDRAGEAGEAFDRLVGSYAAHDAGYELAVRGHLYVFVAMVLREMATPGNTGIVHEGIAWFKQALDFIESECHRPLFLAEVAAAASVSPYHLSHYFRRNTGRTMTEHINLIRVQRARRLLQTSDRKIIDIAAEVGFASINHFLELYKRYCREKPSETRRAQRNGADQSRIAKENPK